MIIENAELTISLESIEAFENDFEKAIPIFKRARGFKEIKLLRTIETLGKYNLLVTWETLEDHTVHFRNSPDFQEWRALVGSYFSLPPLVTHAKVIARG